ncbi:syntaxin-binding protein 4-like isoform X2 [Gigantopelta aegis]|uniref:syntaxin-binding protein 4-like isoform X2 n=1 Tax=Gigantopelta aegis TaxID=1735272 RepID=UPI001B88B75D|nr:syntaxin-binding protein 4-like isoform X2 [Gigantopelta aegis]
MSVTVTVRESENLQSTGLQSDENTKNTDDVDDYREVEVVEFDNCSQGLGLKIFGGSSIDVTEQYGIFVKRILPGGLAETHSNLQEGDQILEVNNTRLDDVSNERNEYLRFVKNHTSQSPFSESPGSPWPSQTASISPGSPMSNEAEASSGFLDRSDPLLSPFSSACHSPRSVDRLGKSPGNSLSRHHSIDPHEKLKVEKLQVALRFLGLEPTPEQRQELHSRLEVDEEGKVSYGDFVRAAKDVFHMQRKCRNIIWPGSAVILAAADVAQNDGETYEDEIEEDFDAIIQERNELRAENQKLKEILQEKDRVSHLELLKVRHEAQCAIQECRDLRKKYEIAQKAQQAARGIEQDYEDVVSLLENEITQLRSQLAKPESGHNGSSTVQKRLAVLVCQLKKAENGRRTYEVATEKLLGYVEQVHNTLSPPTDNIQSRNSGEGDKNRGGSLQKKNKKLTTKALLKEGQEVVKAVKSLIETVALPFGWEEAYTSDGTKYYINHTNQTTTWTHPVSGVQHQSSDPADRKPQTEPHHKNMPRS